MPGPPDSPAQRAARGKFMQQVNAAAPFTSAHKDDAGAWVFEWRPGTTQAQIDAATTLIASFDENAQTAAIQSRIDGLRNDANINDVLDKLANATANQIDNWVAQKLPNADAATRQMFALIFKMLARRDVPGA